MIVPSNRLILWVAFIAFPATVASELRVYPNLMAKRKSVSDPFLG